ncbi:MAG: RluA family pseudouridine synthase [Ruthenibacterium sp.]
MKSFTAGKNEDGVRLSRFVQNVTTNLPTSLLYKSFRNKRIKINGKHADAETRLCVGDLIELYINDEFFADVPQQTPVKKQVRQPALQVVFEDENIAALYKPAHLLCHSDRTGDANLVDAFCAYLTQSGAYHADAENTFAPALCNRLDRGTEGLVLAAKNYAALRDMNEIIRQNLLNKQYFCITVGVPPRGVHKAYLQHREKDNKVSVQANETFGYKEIRTGVTVLEQKGPFCLCKIDLLTGRTHQIRAHLAFLNAPVLGDIKYGNRKMNARCKIETQALCAVQVTFGMIPAENTLAYLSGRTIALQDPQILRQFAAL